MSKRTRKRERASEFIHSEFERALEEDTEYRQNSRARRVEQKTHQLCRQVQRALNLALSELCADGDLDNVFVVDVTAAAGCGRLLVHIAVPDGRSAGVVLAALRERAPRLRAIVTGSISRKRTPELAYVASLREEGSND